MEKNIASYDLSDMMIYERLDAQSRKFYFKQKFSHARKVVEKGVKMLERASRLVKSFSRPTQRLHARNIGFTSTATAVYAIFVASVLISFFWLTMLLSVTP